MAGVKYNYALDEQGRLVSIKQAYLEKNEGHTYRCIGCGVGMIARLGEVRDWHFAHRGDEIHCSTETYLHMVAKGLIKDKFEKNEPFLVGYYRDVKCSDMATCPFAKEEASSPFRKPESFSFIASGKTRSREVASLPAPKAETTVLIMLCMNSEEDRASFTGVETASILTALSISCLIWESA